MNFCLKASCDFFSNSFFVSCIKCEEKDYHQCYGKTFLCLASLYLVIFLWELRTNKEMKFGSFIYLFCLQCLEGTTEKIKKMFNKVELSISSYDTAWVAMVPSTNSPNVPFFPESVTWLLENQLLDGSWGLPDRDPLLLKDALLSTLASVVALRQWGVGEEHTTRGISGLLNVAWFLCLLLYQCIFYTLKIITHFFIILAGLQFIESNIASVIDEKQHSPIGFDIIFPSLLESAQSLGIYLPLGSTNLEGLIHKRQLELSQ